MQQHILHAIIGNDEAEPLGRIEPLHVTIEFEADTPGTFPFYCSEFCSALHLEMMGYLMVEPN